MSTQDEEIARHLREALASGELKSAEGFGKPFVEDIGWAETPAALRMPFKILKNAGMPPPEIEWFRERARLAAAIRACDDEAEREALQKRLSDLAQKIAIRLESLRAGGNL